jgi:hypothetical protein
MATHDSKDSAMVHDENTKTEPGSSVRYSGIEADES